MQDAHSPLEYFYLQEASRPDTVWMHQPKDGSWTTYTWGQAGEQARRMAAALKSLDLPKGSRISILAKNCAHWYICDLAIMMSGHVSAPAFTSMSKDGFGHLLKNSDTKCIFVGPADNWPAVKDVLTDDMKIISLPGVSPEIDHTTWDDMIADVEPLVENVTPAADDLCTIVYTSGTFGLPKGVMHTHQSIANVGRASTLAYGLTEADRFISYLPLSHIFERAVLMFSMDCGGQVYFNEHLETFADDISTCRPTIMFGPPRIWTKFQQAVSAKAPPQKLKRLLKIPLLSSFVRKKLLTALGLQETRYLFTGGGQTPPEVYEWYEAMRMPLHDIYGMTEACPATVSLPGARKQGAVGKPVAGAEIKIADNGEILTRTPCMTIGYCNDPEKTAQDLAGGWMHTGDKGKIDNDGFLWITGRIKEIYKTAKGKYVAPAAVEGLMAECPAFEQLCLIGAGLPTTVMLAELSEVGTSMARSKLEATLLAQMDKVNQSLENHERMSHIVVAREPWTVENGLVTHTFKIKRPLLEAKYDEFVKQVLETQPANSIVFENEFPQPQTTA